MSIAEYYTRAKVIWDEIDSLTTFPICNYKGCTCTLTKKFLAIQQDQRLTEFLMKLHESYSQIKSNILMMSPLPSISQAYRILVAELKHKDIGKQSLTLNEALGFAAEKSHNKPSYYHIEATYRNKGSTRTGRFHSNNKKQSNLVCEHCHMTGHTANKCYKLHGYPQTHPRHNIGRKMANSAQNQGSVITANNFTSEQYSYLMNLINKEKEQDQMNNMPSEDTNNSALLLGKYFFLSKNSID